MFWNKSKKRFPLPKFPDTIRPTFRALCAIISEEELAQLRDMVHKTEASIISKSATNGNIDKDIVDDIARACLYLLDRYSEVNPQHQKLITGAVRYFIAEDDPFDDTIFASGLDDDIRIVNHVYEELGFDDRYIAEV